MARYQRAVNTLCDERKQNTGESKTKYLNIESVHQAADLRRRATSDMSSAAVIGTNVAATDRKLASYLSQFSEETISRLQEHERKTVIQLWHTVTYSPPESWLSVIRKHNPTALAYAEMVDTISSSHSKEQLPVILNIRKQAVKNCRDELSRILIEKADRKLQQVASIPLSKAQAPELLPVTYYQQLENLGLSLDQIFNVVLNATRNMQNVGRALSKANANTIRGKYQAMGIPFNHQTLPTDGKILPHSRRALQKGQSSTVYKATIENQDTSRDIVFKPERLLALRQGAAWSGIPTWNPRYGTRSLATYIVATKLLQFENLVPHTEFAIFNGELGTIIDFIHERKVISEEVAIPLKGIISLTGHPLHDGINHKYLAVKDDPKSLKAFLKRHDIHSIRIQGDHMLVGFLRNPPNHISNPFLQREFTKARLVDYLTGQLDRHINNYIISHDSDGNAIQLALIDNEQSFPWHNSLNPDLTFHGASLPSIIDSNLRDAFNALTPERLKNELSELLQEKEIAAAQERLAIIKEHINNPQKCRVVDPSDWGSDEITDYLRNDKQSGMGDYWRRHFEDVENTCYFEGAQIITADGETIKFKD